VLRVGGSMRRRVPAAAVPAAAATTAEIAAPRAIAAAAASMGRRGVAVEGRGLPLPPLLLLLLLQRRPTAIAWEAAPAARLTPAAPLPQRGGRRLAEALPSTLKSGGEDTATRCSKRRWRRLLHALSSRDKAADAGTFGWGQRRADLRSPIIIRRVYHPGSHVIAPAPSEADWRGQRWGDTVRAVRRGSNPAGGAT
jgi:hypothetical protein